MNYVYIEASDATSHETEDIVVISSDKNSQTYKNIAQNQQVALLIHDWTTAKTIPGTSSTVSSIPSSGVSVSSLSQIIFNLNQNALSNHSVNLSGVAQVVDQPEATEFYKAKLLQAEPDAACFIEPESVAVIKIKVKKAKVSDSSNHISQYGYVQ